MAIEKNMITTCFELSGYSIVESLGIARGILVRSPGFGGNFVAGWQTMFAGKVKAFTDVCEKTRDEAFQLLIKDAEKHGANAIVGVRYDSNEIGTCTEILVYGTAVRVQKS